MFVKLDWKRLTNDKHSSLIRKSVIYEQKSFITLGPGRYAQFRYSGCHVFFLNLTIVMLNVIIKSIMILSVVPPLGQSVEHLRQT